MEADKGVGTVVEVEGMEDEKLVHLKFALCNVNLVALYI